MMLTLTMLFAGGYHLSSGERPESAFVYLAIYLTLFFAGPGKLSFDLLETGGQASAAPVGGI